uniref:Type 4 fimbrial biogenesis protein PilX N-terminal domain-containing protein n=1 Tax=Cyanothece sp. (strain PCC 7425 / ATCC 29141) TaxID=395961 RepID=B8HSW5_CYAP4
MRRRQRYSRLHRFSRNQGFTLPLIMGLGLLMVMIAVTLLLRTQTQQATSSSQKASEQSIAVAEIGLTRIQEFLSLNRVLTNQDNITATTSWSSYLQGLGCSSSNLATPYLPDATVNTAGGQFKVVTYTKPSSIPGSGTLFIDGVALQGTETRSTTRLRTRITVSRNIRPATNPPELWAQDFTFPASGTQINGTSTTQIVEAKCGTIASLVGTGNRISAGNAVSDPMRALPNSLTTPSTFYDLGAVNAGVTILPRAGDTVNGPNGEYVYRASSVNLPAGSTQLIVTPGMKVNLYLSGNLLGALSAGGASTTRVKIGHDCTDTDSTPDGMSNGSTIVAGCTASNFKIFGISTATSPTISFASRHTAGLPVTGQTTTEAVIIAPNYTVTVGQNLYTTQFKGIIWAREINLSQGTTTVTPVPATWDELQQPVIPLSPPGSLYPLSISGISAWERCRSDSTPPAC